MNDVTETSHPATEQQKGGLSGFMIGCAILFFIAALIISLEVFGVISGILFPPDAPIPPNSEQTDHTNLEFGVDSWSYTTTESPCQVIQFYENNQSTCTLSGDYCKGPTFDSPGYSLDSVATCIGTDDFSVFGLRWTVEISTQVRRGIETTHFDLLREILWSGPAPQATSTANAPSDS